MVSLPGGTPGQIGANPGLTYDAPAARWVPVPLHWLSPDGRVYAYQPGRDAGLRAVTVASGSTTVLTATGTWDMLGMADNGALAAEVNTPGAWFLPLSGQPQRLVDHGSWQRAANGALWGVDSAEHLVRHDITSGSETAWGSVLSVSDVMGFDAAGEPIVATGGALDIHHADGSTTSVWPGTNGLSAGGYAFGDAHGIWFEVDAASGLVGAPGSGIYLWTANGATRVTAEPVHPMGICS